ncbi:uncharacterized protein LOC144547572 isoform X1 [Carex rostrata]
MASGSKTTQNGTQARKHMAELEKNYRLQHVEIEMLRAELAMVKESNRVLSNLNANLKEREGGCVRVVEEKERRLSEALELVESLKKEVFELENLRNVKELMEYKNKKDLELQANEQAMEVIKKLNSDLKAKNEKLMATMQKWKMKFHQLYKENRKIPELSAEVDRLRQQLSQDRVLKEDDMTS